MRKSYVYFMQDVQTGLIKIGTSTDPHHRRSRVQVEIGRPVKLLGFMPEPVPLEKLLHDKFDRFREYKEWFRPDPELREFIDLYGANVHDAEWNDLAIITLWGMILNRDKVITILLQYINKLADDDKTVLRKLQVEYKALEEQIAPIFPSLETAPSIPGSNGDHQ